MTDSTDIVARLRAVLHNDRSVELMNREAADEIERLRAELVSTTNKLTAERDEARRDFCHCDDGWPFDEETARERANQLGWDCFPKPDPADLEADAQ